MCSQVDDVDHNMRQVMYGLTKDIVALTFCADAKKLNGKTWFGL